VRDWGGKPYSDLMTGVDAMIRLGLADSTRLAVCGRSHGGFVQVFEMKGKASSGTSTVAGCKVFLRPPPPRPTPT
jgi:hypothetical protein